MQYVRKSTLLASSFMSLCYAFVRLRHCFQNYPVCQQGSVSTRGKLKYALVPEMAINKLFGMLQIHHPCQFPSISFGIPAIPWQWDEFQCTTHVPQSFGVVMPCTAPLMRCFIVCVYTSDMHAISSVDIQYLECRTWLCVCIYIYNIIELLTRRHTFALLSIDPSPTHPIYRTIINPTSSVAPRMQTWKWKSNAISTQRRCLPWWCCIPYSSQFQHFHMHVASKFCWCVDKISKIAHLLQESTKENHGNEVSLCCIYTTPKFILISTDVKAHVRPYSVANFNRDSLCSITNSLEDFSQVCPWHVLAVDVVASMFTYTCNNTVSLVGSQHQTPTGFHHHINTVDTYIKCKRNRISTWWNMHDASSKRLTHLPLDRRHPPPTTAQARIITCASLAQTMTSIGRLSSSSCAVIHRFIHQ